LQVLEWQCEDCCKRLANLKKKLSPIETHGSTHKQVFNANQVSLGSLTKVGLGAALITCWKLAAHGFLGRPVPNKIHLDVLGSKQLERKIPYSTLAISTHLRQINK
jgi:hypothetical protein